MHDIVVRPFVFDFDSAAVAAGRSSDAVDQLNSERPRTSLASPMSRGFGPAMKGKGFTIVPSLRRGLPTSIRLPIRTGLAAILGHDSLHIGGSVREAYDYEGKPEDAPTQPASMWRKVACHTTIQSLVDSYCGGTACFTRTMPSPEVIGEFLSARQVPKVTCTISGLGNRHPAFTSTWFAADFRSTLATIRQ